MFLDDYTVPLFEVVSFQTALSNVKWTLGAASLHISFSFVLQRHNISPVMMQRMLTRMLFVFSSVWLRLSCFIKGNGFGGHLWNMGKTCWNYTYEYISKQHDAAFYPKIAASEWVWWFPGECFLPGSHSSPWTSVLCDCDEWVRPPVIQLSESGYIKSKAEL